MLHYLAAATIEQDEDRDPYIMQEKHLRSCARLLRCVHCLSSRLPALALMAVAPFVPVLARYGTAALAVSPFSAAVQIMSVESAPDT